MSHVDASNSLGIIVLGTYGSGSSAVAGILHHLGVMMGEKLVPATEANPKGHFEDAQFRRLLYQYRNDRSVLTHIEQFIINRFIHYPLWGIKEPETLEAILDFAPALEGYHYKVIQCVRAPSACLRSFKRKWPGSDENKTRTHFEWLLRQSDEFIDTHSPDLLKIDFDELTDDPKTQVESIIAFVFGQRPSIFEDRPWPSDNAIQTAIDSIDPQLNHSHSISAAISPVKAAERYDQDPILKKWVTPYYLEPDTIQEIKASSQAKPFAKYACLDNFFNEAILDEYIEQHCHLEFSPDDKGLPYDSKWAPARRGSLGGELFYHPSWHRLLAEYTDTKLVVGNGETSVKLRAHDPDSKGFWIHTDRTNRKSVVLAALTYLNKDWKESDGAILQLWAEAARTEPLSADAVEFRWKDYKDERLDFLNEHRTLTTHLVKQGGVKPAELFLLDQITPEYNRLVVTDFVRDPAYHSITPSNGRSRYAIVQWLL